MFDCPRDALAFEALGSLNDWIEFAAALSTALVTTGSGPGTYWAKFHARKENNPHLMRLVQRNLEGCTQTVSDLAIFDLGASRRLKTHDQIWRRVRPLARPARVARPKICGSL
ncbi:hypothetical protein JB92DRAFT_3146168 [Gautieria morchelliformis]|nr:hypothetical protein JB92DRAFT_3146168 [Gautieria morchelliformis]